MITNGVWSAYVELGATAYKNGHLDVAEMMLKAAMREKHGRQSDLEGVVITIEALADQFAMLGQYAKAEKLYKRARTYYLRKQKSDEHACRLLYKLTEVFISSDRFAMARRTFAQAYLLAKKTRDVSLEEHKQYLSKVLRLWKRKGRVIEAMSVHAELENLNAR
ncbi:MAG TPA: hypothetical protein V6D17_24395 [Candidatus Obscuribacterales bacterium]